MVGSLFESITEWEGDFEDVALIAHQAELDREGIFEKFETREPATGERFSFAVLGTLDVLEDRYDIVSPITDRLVSYCLEKALLVTLEEPKTIEDVGNELDVPGHRIYDELRTLEAQERVTASRA